MLSLLRSTGMARMLDLCDIVAFLIWDGNISLAPLVFLLGMLEARDFALRVVLPSEMWSGIGELRISILLVRRMRLSRLSDANFSVFCVLECVRR